ncbi:MAG: hypothetical protein A2536_09290 [Candidatus Firestonebacteria bacterium RIFOXYD2_FULL_39_29]|nr:MAG: hypothetical protein A2536_09290 [Candidatus Firestonebacteria bacterium RIFOXYD2_FULL_39_29]
MTNKTEVPSSEKRNISKERLLKEIENKAYELFFKRNGKHGSDLADWLEAEKIVKKQYGIK